MIQDLVILCTLGTDCLEYRFVTNFDSLIDSGIAFAHCFKSSKIYKTEEEILNIVGNRDYIIHDYAKYKKSSFESLLNESKICTGKSGG